MEERILITALVDMTSLAQSKLAGSHSPGGRFHERYSQGGLRFR